MEMEPLVSLGTQALLHTETAVQDHNLCVLSSTPDRVKPQQPVKKQTRQWAAWTRQEEESFFTALRQVGKNFEKITHRVQSKNKDQVRHYYYRLVRRMNKLLGPGLCLDAKNSKDTNAAMLRWWSLLEKYSCKASKLHLKPRRFKIFLEALENQLIKDRKKNERKRPLQGESGSPVPTGSATKQNRASAQDSLMVKLVFIDGQNIQKLGGNKGSLRRNANVGVMRNASKGSPGLMKPPRQKRKQGAVTPGTYKKWERAAMAGVSLVADAAEHFERTAIDKDVDADQEKDLDPVYKELSPLPVPSHNQNGDSNVSSNLKLKLKFFPIDDVTRKALEMDKHNPHLELTLSGRKKISSVLEHLNRKWGNSSVASGDLMLFPYSASRENLLGYQRWTQDSNVCATDIYNSLGNPPVFRLRYGWFSGSGLPSTLLQAPSMSSCTPSGNDIDTKTNKQQEHSPASTTSGSQKLVDVSQDRLPSMNKTPAPTSPLMEIPSGINGCVSMGPISISSNPMSDTLSCLGKATNDRNYMKQLEDGDELRLSNTTALSAGEWADSLTNIIVGDLLSEVANDVTSNCIVIPMTQNDECLPPIPFSCDSFDAAIAAHISKHQNKLGCPPLVQPHTSSIWDADETCDAFSFQKNHISHREVTTTSGVTSSAAGKQDFPNMGGQLSYSTDGDPMDEDPLEQEVMDNPSKDFSGLADIYWPDSLGAFDLDIPSYKSPSEDIVLTDSLGGLNRLIASSLDAFQNCSFLGLAEKKDSASTLEAR